MKEKELFTYLKSLCPEENEGCEWKEFKNLKHAVSGKKGEDIISYISALANMEGGCLVVGVKDKTLSIVGIESLHDYTPENIKQRILGKCTNLDSESFRVDPYLTIDSGKTVWVFRVPKHRPRLPVYAHDKAWQRVGDSLAELRPERQSAILSETIEKVDWSAAICKDAHLSDLSLEAIARARIEYKSKFPRKTGEVDSWDDTTFLNKIRLTIQGQVTNAAILLLGRPESASLISPAVAKISWILKDQQNREKDYEHFGPPFLLNVDSVYAKVRNLTYRHLPSGTLFPLEISQYDRWVIREVLHNCIAHQDYSLGGRIILVETPSSLLLANVGSFMPGSVETVIRQDAPPEVYRNSFLADAMVNLNMIDTQGGGIKKMFHIQMKRFFPLPDYDLSDPGRVKVTIRGEIIDEKYTQMLMEKTDFDLWTVILLDKVQKKMMISRDEHKRLKALRVVEGRYPNIFISSEIAAATGGKAEHIRYKGFDNQYYRDILVELIREHGPVSRRDIDRLLMNKLPDVLTEVQKKKKIHNLLYALSGKMKRIRNIGTRKIPQWVVSGKDANKSNK
ncbi:MAG: putative DNA binding domain-containing protein [Proteobacteria bacterium]|nr:putative DNA binding domain-containing protein [Pseudomonadota bacterium]MBU1685876.1 putative DNA binding domain-containing protein [Pseudomonadota bacterium]